PVPDEDAGVRRGVAEEPPAFGEVRDGRPAPRREWHAVPAVADALRPPVRCAPDDDPLGPVRLGRGARDDAMVVHPHGARPGPTEATQLAHAPRTRPEEGD